jgi:hypothetical protein
MKVLKVAGFAVVTLIAVGLGFVVHALAVKCSYGKEHHGGGGVVNNPRRCLISRQVAFYPPFIPRLQTFTVAHFNATVVLAGALNL